MIGSPAPSIASPDGPESSDEIEARARAIAAGRGREEPDRDDRALAWAELLETGWLHASVEIPLSTFFRLLCARAARGLRDTTGEVPLTGRIRPATEN